jgi:hypothetical protein
LVVTFWLVAGAVAYNWHLESKSVRPSDTAVSDISGDEPHYLVITRSLFVHGSVDQSDAYDDAFAPGGFLAGAPREQAHALIGRNGGYYPVHGLGLPILLGPGWLLAGTFGTHVTAVLAGGLAVLCVGYASMKLFESRGKAALIAVATCFTVPIILGATRLYPDLLTGCAALATFTSVSLGPRVRKRSLDVALAVLIAWMPWLHVKNAFAALICGAVLVIAVHRSGEPRRARTVAAVVIGSLVGVVLFNLYTFGRLTGPFQDNSWEFSRTSLVVFSGLHLDRAQGMFVMSPVLLIGVAELLIRLVRRERWSVALPLTYVALILPNALHPNWYGGYSFVGRFGWSAAALLMLPTVQGLKRLNAVSSQLTTGVASASIALQVVFAWQYVSGHHHLYNQPAGTPLDAYSTLWGPVGRWLPALYDSSFAFQSVKNWIWILAMLLMMILVAGVQALYQRRDREPRLRSLP